MYSVDVTKEQFLAVIPPKYRHFSPLLDAIKLAQKTHKTQKRDGKDYLTDHIWVIAKQVAIRYLYDKSYIVLVIASILHDVVEADRSITIRTLEKRFGKEVAEIIDILTKTVEEDSKTTNQELKFMRNLNYMNRVIERGGNALIIKLEDRIANLRSFSKDVFLSRPDKYQRYLKEAESIFLPIAKQYDTAGEILKDLKKEIRRIKRIVKKQSQILASF